MSSFEKSDDVDVRDDVERAGDKVEDKLDRAGDKAENTLDRAGDKIHDAVKDAIPGDSRRSLAH